MASTGTTVRSPAHRRNLWWAIPLMPALGITAVALASAVRGLSGVLTVLFISIGGLATALFAAWKKSSRWYVKAAVGTVICVVAAAAGAALPSIPGVAERGSGAANSASPSPDRPTAVSSPLPMRLSGAQLVGADMRGVQLRGADLRGTNLSQADLRFVDLTDACLRGADLTGAKIGGTTFDGADLSGAKPSSLPRTTPSVRACT